jgi:hypothetical protein
MVVGFPFVGNTIFRRYISRKNKKKLPMVLQMEIARQKKTISRLKYTDGF